MMKAKNTLLDTLFDKFLGHLPSGLMQFEEDLKTQIRQAFNKVLNDCHIVTTEEFDSFQKALERTQKRLHELEQALETLKKEQRS